MAVHEADIVIIGSGAGGGTLAHALVPGGRRILLIERGHAVASEPENWSPTAVWKDLRYRTREQWLDRDGALFTPYTHYGIGGNTKFWGSVLYRLRREDFGEVAHMDGVSPAWPISYDDLAPWYDRAERLYQVHGDAASDPTEPRCRIGWIRVPGGAELEIFEFQPQLPAERIPWNRVGQTHFSFNVRNVHKWCAYLEAKGVEIVSRPEQSPRGHWFFFVRDLDGNLIELIDLRHMYYVLGWLGALGGWLFRRGMYRKYYE